MPPVNIQEVTTPFAREELVKALSRRSYPFFLESRMINPRFGRYSFFGAEPFIVLESKGRNITIKQGKKKYSKQGNPWQELRRILRTYRIKAGPYPVPFVGGGVGYLGYDLCHFVEKLPRTTRDDLPFPDMFFAFYNRLVARDHLNDKTYFISSEPAHPADLFTAPERNEPSRINHLSQPGEVKSNFTKAGYLAAVRRVKEYIAAGDIYQVNLSQRFNHSFAGSPLDLYERLGRINPAPFSGFLQPAPDKFVVSSSPERFLKKSGGHIETRPIKGTRPRGHTKAKDDRLKQELYRSPKDNAELAMIVDIERNDLGRVCRYGSVKVTERKILESYPTVHHLVATVEGDIARGCNTVDLLRATFPGGSITGAPKIRAMEIIDELEPTARGPYTGAIGWLGFDGALDLSIAIRILVGVKTANKPIHKVYYQVGGGIVADSDPAAEYQETLDKGKALQVALCRTQ